MPLTLFDVNTAQDGLIALGLGAGTYVLLALIQGIAVARLGAMASRTDTDIDDAIVDLVRRTRWFFLAVLAVLVGAQWLVIPGTIGRYAGRVIALVVLLQVGLWVAGLVAFLTDRALHRRRDAQDRVGVAAIRALGVAAKVVAWTILVVAALRWAFGLDVTLLVTSLGVGGIAIALAVQQVLGDVLAAISIVFDQPFDVGDDITVEGVSGTVEKVGLKTTRLRSASGEQIVFSNANLLKSRIHNYSRMGERRLLQTFEIASTTPPDTAARVPAMIEAVIREQAQTRFVRAHLVALAGTGLRYEYLAFVLDRDYALANDIQQAIHLGLLRRFAEERIELAQPPVPTATRR